ncbi:MAG: copper-binding protein [Bryobacterales bacterium]|nr:copper-binding protein [Bryobacterales bacterium]
MQRRLWLSSLLCIFSWTAACNAPPPAPAKQYQVRGVVVGLTPPNRLVKLEHGEIKGWMEAMTMEFPVPDGAEYAQIKLGQTIEATVNVRDIDYWLTGIRVVAPPAAGVPTP